MDSWSAISRRVQQDLETFLSALQNDPQLQGLDNNGLWLVDTDPLALVRLEASLHALQLSLDSYPAVLECHDGRLLALPSSGPTTAQYMLTENPALSQGVLEFIALAVRWPLDVLWPPLEPSQDAQPSSVHEQTGGFVSAGPAGAGSPQLSGSTARATLADMRVCALDILLKLLELGQTEPACRLGCALLRMHTLQACSRSLARAVDRLRSTALPHTPSHSYAPSEPNMVPQHSVIIPQLNTHPGPDLHQPPHTHETPRTDSGDTSALPSGQGPPGGTDGTQLAPDAATAAFSALSCTVSCGIDLLQCCCHVLDSLEGRDQGSGGSGLDAGDPQGRGGVPSRLPGSTDSHSDDSSSGSGDGGGVGCSDNGSNGQIGHAGGDRASGTGAAEGGGGGGGGGPAGPPSVAVVGVLREALLGSGLVEHVARGVLHLLLAGRSDEPDAMHQLRVFVEVYEALASQLDPTYGRGVLGGTCTAVLGGPCAAYLAAAAGLQVMCTVDGGPSYGMCDLLTEDEMRECWLQAAGSAGGEGEEAAQHTRLGVGSMCLDDRVLKALLYALVNRPPKRRSLMSILLRLGYLAVALGQRGAMLSGEAGAGGSGDRGGAGGSAAGQQGRSLFAPGLKISIDGPDRLAMSALRGYRLQCALLRGARRLEAEVEGRRLACTAARELLAAAAATSEEDVEVIASHLHVPLPALPDNGPLPLEPPADLAAALSGGLLPCLERILRRAAAGAAAAAAAPGDVPAAGTDARVAEAQLLVCILTMYKSHPFLEGLLAYGHPTEVAALIASVGKLLRSVVGQLLPTDDSGERQPYALLAELATSAASIALDQAYGWMSQRTPLGTGAAAAAADEAGGAGSGAATTAGTAAGAASAADTAAGAAAAAGVGGVAEEADGQGPGWQLRRMAVLAACEWLPTLFGVVTEAARRVLLAGALQQQVPELRAGSPLLELVRLCMYGCSLWLPMAASYAEEPGRTSGPSTSSQAGPGEAVQLAAVGELGRRRLRRLAQEAPPVQLLGAGMVLESYLAASGAVSAAAGGQLWDRFIVVNRQLLTVSCVLAVTSPAEVRRALACGAAPGYPVHCMWSSGTVRQLLRALPPSTPRYTHVQVLADLLAACEGGAEDVSMTNRAYRSPAGRRAVGSGFLEALGLELEQPSPLRRCSWWRCANLAGDSEAGLPLQACARCGGAWYCGRACQVAHWRAGHKAECGVGTGGQGEERGQACRREG